MTQIRRKSYTAMSLVNGNKFELLPRVFIFCPKSQTGFSLKSFLKPLQHGKKPLFLWSRKSARNRDILTDLMCS